jgi:hypothetical protein
MECQLHPPGSYILVPKMVVTPEYKALNGGTVAFWAAVQVSIEVCSPSTPDPPWSAFDLGRSTAMSRSMASGKFESGSHIEDAADP